MIFVFGRSPWFGGRLFLRGLGLGAGAEGSFSLKFCQKKPPSTLTNRAFLLFVRSRQS